MNVRTHSTATTRHPINGCHYFDYSLNEMARQTCQTNKSELRLRLIGTNPRVPAQIKYVWNEIKLYRSFVYARADYLCELRWLHLYFKNCYSLALACMLYGWHEPILAVFVHICMQTKQIDVTCHRDTHSYSTWQIEIHGRQPLLLRHWFPISLRCFWSHPLYRHVRAEKAFWYEFAYTSINWIGTYLSSIVWLNHWKWAFYLIFN